MAGFKINDLATIAEFSLDLSAEQQMRVEQLTTRFQLVAKTFFATLDAIRRPLLTHRVPLKRQADRQLNLFRQWLI